MIEGTQATTIPRYALFVGFTDQAKEYEFGFETCQETADSIEELVDRCRGMAPDLWWQIVDFLDMQIILRSSDMTQLKS